MHLILLLSLIIIDIVCEKWDKIENKRLAKVIGMGMAMFLFGALRSVNVGTDLPNYFRYFEKTTHLSTVGIFKVFLEYEPVFFIFLKSITLFSKNPQLMLVVISGIVAAGLSYFIYHQKCNPLMVYMMFICLRLFPFTLSGLRQAVAMAITWVAFVHLIKGRDKKFWLFLAIAFLFHTSSIVFILVYPLYKMRSTKFVLFSAAGIYVFSLCGS